MAELMLVFGFMFVGFALFVIYFIFKQLQFVLVSVNLYKKMVRRQDAIIRLLLDVRDNTKTYQNSVVSDEDKDDVDNKTQPAKEVDAKPPDGRCQSCGNKLSLFESRWERNELIVCHSCSVSEDFPLTK